MNRVLKTLTLISFLAVAMVGVRAQDVGFSQFYANQLYLNPAFAGSKVAPRFSLNFRHQWPALVSAYSTLSASYDQYIDALHGGIGVIVMADRQGDHGMLGTYNAGLAYSFRFQVSRTIFVNAALQASIVNTTLNWDESTMRFPDQIDPVYGYIWTTSAVPPENTGKWFADFHAGALVYGESWYAGVAAAHLNRPNQGFYSEDRVPMKLTAHAGGMINMAAEQRRTSSLGLGTPIISPNIIYQYQGNFHYFNYGLYLDWEPFMVGAWFRHGIENVDAFIFMIGIQQDYFKIGYSYDVTVSKLANNTNGSHEISLGFLLPTPDPKKKVRAIRCPSF